MKIRWGFAEVSTAFVHKDHESQTTRKSATPNKYAPPTTPQEPLILQNGQSTIPSHPTTISSHHPNIYTIKDMRGPRLLFLQLPSHSATISSHHPNIYTIKDMRGCHLPYLQLPSHQPKRGERNQCLWFLPHLWLHGHYRANIIVIDNVRIHLQVKSSSSPYPLQHQP